MIDTDTLAAELTARVPERTLGTFRFERAAVVVPLLERLVGGLRGRRVVELGSGEPLLLAKALATRGAEVVAIDPCLSDPRVEPGPIAIRAEDAFTIDPTTIAPADVTLSTLLFGAPLRQRARRSLWPAYRAGARPTETRVHEVLRANERTLIERLTRWTRPGGWSVHHSLEGLFTATAADWLDAGFALLGEPTGDDAAARVLRTFRIARRLGA